MTPKYDDSDLANLLQSLDREMEQERDRETPFDSKAAFHRLLAVRQSRRRQHRWTLTGSAVVLLLTLGTIGLQMRPNTADPSTAKQDNPPTTKKIDPPAPTKTIANNRELLAAQLAIAKEHQARLELLALRSQNAMKAPSLVIDSSLMVKLHSEASRSVEMPNVSDILSGKYKTSYQ